MKRLKIKFKYYFYILKCRDKTLYCGMTKDLKKRTRLHNAGLGSVYVRTHGGGKIIYSEAYKKIGDALRREIEVKKWPRIRKLILIKNQASMSLRGGQR